MALSKPLYKKVLPIPLKRQVKNQVTSKLYKMSIEKSELYMGQQIDMWNSILPNQGAERNFNDSH